MIVLGRILEGDHASFVESVPFKTIALFTLMQILYFLLCFGVTWIPIGGVLFPLPFFLLIVLRERVLPKIFCIGYLQELDSSEYEEVAGAPMDPTEVPSEVDNDSDIFFDAELLDEMTTHRGEMKHRMSFTSEDRY